MATLYVYASDAAATAAGKNAGEYYTSIQAAVNDANSGDTIEIAAGTYAGDVTLQKDVVTGGAKALTFVGAEGAEVVIQGKVQISGASAVWDVQTIFKNITFQQVNEGGEVKGGVEIGRGDSQGNNYTNKFEKCIFIGNGFDNNVISTTARSNATKNEYEGCRFVNTNMSLYSEHSFSNCNFENAVPNFQNEQKISFNGCNFKLTVTDDMKDEDELYLIRTKGSIVADKCTFEFDNPDNVVPTAENPQWSFIWGRNDYGQGNFEISNSSFTAGENTSDVDMFHTEVRDAEKDNGSFNVTDSVAKGNIDFAEAAKGVANVTIENENKEDGTKDIIITDKTGESLLVGSVDDQGQLTINAEKSQGENFAALAADYANKAADKDYPVYVLSENGSMTGYDTLAEAAAAASAGEKIVISGNVSGKAVFADGKNYTITYYNLDAIISVGYRVNSIRGTQFRIWATQQLRELMCKGFVLDRERLKNPPIKGVTALPDYFDDLLEQIRDIRASERRMYLRIRDIFALSADYTPNNRETNIFFSTIQNKLHYAIHGHTAAELIMLRADAAQPNMGLTSWQRERVLATDVGTAKNYLRNEEIESFNRLTSMCLDFVEDQAKQRKQVFMKDWEKAIDGLLTLTGRHVLQGKGHCSMADARERAQEQYQLFCERRREAAEHLAELELQKTLETEIANLRSANKR